MCIFAIYVFFLYNEKRGKNCDFRVFCDIYKNDSFSEMRCFLKYIQWLICGIYGIISVTDIIWRYPEPVY